MSEERATLEKIAPTVEEAVADALSELGLSEDDVDIEILDEGSKGLLGIGGRQARVRLTIKGEGGEMPKPASKPAPRQTESSGDVDIDNLLSIAEATVNELLEKMRVSANVSARTVDEMHPDGTPNVVVDISGDDLSILIGRKAETLDALQFITRLIVGKEMGRAAHLSIDVEGYRSRRERSLEQLAHRMANQAIKTGRRQTLEPMPPNERRIIHIALRDNDEVSTESVGEEPRRKVMIIPNE
jgi:spoIIIJ-associated protein